MKFDFKGIFEGAWNSVFVKKEIEKVAEERTKVCKECIHNSDLQKQHNNYKTLRPDFHCTICGCDLHMKTRCMGCECPIKKWAAQISPDEQEKLDKKLEEDETSKIK